MSITSELESSAFEILDEAVDTHNPAAVYALFSGGNDSLTIAHLASQHPSFKGVVHIDTGVELEITRQYVQEVCQMYGWDLKVYKARENTRADGTPDPMEYERFVREVGFPTAPGHAWMYNRLKERQIDRLMRDTQRHRGDRVVLVSGVRKHESQRRMMNVSAAGRVDRRGSRVWANIIADLTTADRNEALKTWGLYQNPLKTEYGNLLGHSGDCSCLAEGSTAEWEIEASLFPNDPTVLLIEQLSEEVKALGFPWGPGGEIPEWWGVSNRKSELYQRWQTTQNVKVKDTSGNLCGSCNRKCTIPEIVSELPVFDVPQQPIILVKPMLENTMPENTMPENTMAIGLNSVMPTQAPDFSSVMPTKALDFGFSLPVLRGVQAGADFYTATIPLKVVVELFQFKDQELPDEIRAQRPLNPKRGEQIAAYMISHPETYVFPAITAALTKDCKFVPIFEGADMGYLRIPPGIVPVCDGQHRLYGIDIAIQDDPRFENESISVTFFIADTLERRLQIFAHINRYAQKPTGSTNRSYDLEDIEAQRSKTVKNTITLYRVLVDEHKTSIPKGSIKLFPFAGFDDATRTLLNGCTLPDSMKLEIATAFWSVLAETFVDWQRVLDREINADVIRANYVHHLAVVLIGIAQVAHDLIEQPQWQEKLKELRLLDWSRTNPDWQHLFIYGGRVQKGAKYSAAIANYLRHKLDIA